MAECGELRLFSNWAYLLSASVCLFKIRSILYGNPSRSRIMVSWIFSSETFSVGLGTVVVVEYVAGVWDAGTDYRFV